MRVWRFCVQRLLYGSNTTMTTESIELPTVVRDEVDDLFQYEDLWAVIVWNDDVTTFETVIRAFMEIFHHSHERSEQLAWKIHRTGKAVVAIRPMPEASDAVHKLHARKIQATLDKA